jgi:hypothetical protein
MKDREADPLIASRQASEMTPGMETGTEMVTETTPKTIIGTEGASEVTAEREFGAEVAQEMTPGMETGAGREIETTAGTEIEGTVGTATTTTIGIDSAATTEIDSTATTETDSTAIAGTDSTTTTEIERTAETGPKVGTETGRETTVGGDPATPGEDRDPMKEIDGTLAAGIDEDTTVETREPEAEMKINKEESGPEKELRTTGKISTEQLGQTATKVKQRQKATGKNSVHWLRSREKGGKPRSQKTKPRPWRGPNRSWRKQGPEIYHG